MWNLVTGVLFSDDSDEDDDTSKDTSKAKKTPHQALKPREQGDGSEQDKDGVKQDIVIVPQKTTVATTEKKKNNKPMIHLPQTNITLDKLPPIRDEGVHLKQTAPRTPLVQMSAPQASNNRQPKRASSNKEPKFVPYEPYKAAVTPITTDAAPRLRRVNNKTKTPPTMSRNSSVESQLAAKKALDEEVKEASIDRETKNAIAEKDKEINRLRAELAESTKQLRIQSQVNSEVKRLLVASVGEDIEAKVDYLTQDKAKLSADIRSYASKISRDFEEKEKLSVESNLWKSKFLACSVIVDELARWKASLMHTNESYGHQVRLLLHEHSVLWNSLLETYATLERLSKAFDPLQAETKDAPPKADAVSLLGLADYALRSATTLRDRLVGHTGVKEVSPGPDSSSAHMPEMIETPAEEGLKEILSIPTTDGNADYSELASLAVTDAARPHLRKLGDQMSAPTGFKCCTHCQGTVHNI